MGPPSPSAAPTGPATAGATSGSQISVPPSLSPSASARTKAEDAAEVKKALVTAADLGKPWTQPKAVARVKGKQGEVCPGHVSATDKVSVTAHAAANLTEGRGAGKTIAIFKLSTLADDSDSALVAAYVKDQRAWRHRTHGQGSARRSQSRCFIRRPATRRPEAGPAYGTRLVPQAGTFNGSSLSAGSRAVSGSPFAECFSCGMLQLPVGASSSTVGRCCCCTVRRSGRARGLTTHHSSPESTNM